MVKSKKATKIIDLKTQKKIDKAKNVLKKFKSQHDESSASLGFADYDSNELQTLADGNVRNVINQQDQLRKLFIIAAYQYSELEFMFNINDNYDKLNDDQKPKIYDLPYSEKMWNNEIALKQHNYKSTISEYNLQIDRLKNVGFTKEDIEKVCQGEKITDIELLKKKQEEYNKKKLEQDKKRGDTIINPDLK